MDIKEINSAKALDEEIKKEEAKARLVAEAKREEHLHKKNELELSKEGNQSAADANKIATDSNKIAQESNQISRRSNKLAWVALAITIISPIVSYLIK